MRVLVLSDYFSYDSVGEGESPIATVRVFDISTDEKFTSVKNRIMAENKEAAADIAYGTLYRTRGKPKPPMFTADQVSDTDLIHAATQKHEAEVADWQRKQDVQDLITQWEEEDAALPQEILDEIWEILYVRLSETPEDGYILLKICETE